MYFQLFIALCLAVPTAAQAADADYQVIASMQPARAETAGGGAQGLHDVLAATWRNNPQIQAARAELRAVEENHPQAAAGYKPALNTEARTASVHQNGDAGDVHSDEKTLSLSATQALYRGGRTQAGLRAATQQAEAQRARLRGVEQDILLRAVTAYVDVVRDRAIVQLNVGNEKILTGQLEAAYKRFELGGITKTDVSQAEMRLAEATAALAAAQGSLKNSEARFTAVTGMMPPGTLAMPDTQVPLPPTLDMAVTLAESGNPALQAARHAQLATAQTTRIIRGETRPLVDVTAAVSRIYDPEQSTDDVHDTTSLVLRATLPLYTGGATRSRIRQSQQTEQQRRREADAVLRSVREAVASAWQDLATATAAEKARGLQISAARAARDGVQFETDYGARTLLDLLDAEQEYLDAQVSHTAAASERVVAAYALLAAMGRLAPGKTGPAAAPDARNEKPAQWEWE